ncbi:alpha-L-rhamnosidase-related protein [Paenibacillus sp. IITD108]|uniref:alpha-L-rhamnosidase-related protein n=1 Tax=Paenibacillus sp. IITD108 TaxID=3116649 RepID=UPI002F419B9B
MDRIDIAPYLKQGKNVIAILAAYFPSEGLSNVKFLNGPASLISSDHGGFLFAEDIHNSIRFGIESDERWMSRMNGSYSFRFAVQAKYAGDMEDVDGRTFPFDWYGESVDSREWRPAIVINGSENSLRGGVLNNWPLRERDIPLMNEVEIKFQKILKQSAAEIPWHNLLSGKQVTIPANQSVWVEIDAGFLTTSYIRTLLEDGDCSTIRTTYAESYIQGFTEAGVPIKEVRDDIKGQLWGEYDTFVTRLGAQHYEPLMYRTFRFVRFEISTGNRPLTILNIAMRETGYPLEVEGRIALDRPDMQQLWDISIRTLRRCMHDSYVDCPYYEQMQYTMDTMLQMLFTYQVSMDDRLAKKAIYDFHSSMMPDGMIACNWPSKFVQVIPGFSFFWIMMLDHHYTYYKELDFIYQYLPSVDRILQYFEFRIDPETKLIKDAGYWQFVDWTMEWSETFGASVRQDQTNIIYNMMFIYGLQVAARLNRYVGYSDRAAFLDKLAEQTKQAVRKQSWDLSKGLFRDAPEIDRYSQHAQVWAVLAEVITGDEARKLMHRCLTNTELAQCSYSMSFFLFRALEKVQLYSMTEGLWTRWLSLLDKHLTTWPEDLLTQRSDCHAWGAVPLYEYSACVLGVKPHLPGYEEVEIHPVADYISRAEGTVATKWGPISVKWERSEESFTIMASLPRECKAVVIFPDGCRKVVEGKREIHMTHRLISLSTGETQNKEAVQ